MLRAGVDGGIERGVRGVTARRRVRGDCAIDRPIAAGVAAGPVAGVVGALVQRGEYATSNDAGACVGNACTQRGLDDRSSASTTAAASTGFFIGGALLLATGVVLYLTAPSSPSSPSPGARSAAASW